MKLGRVPIRLSMCLNRFSSVKAKALIGTFQRSYYDENFHEISLTPVMAILRCSGIHSYGATVQYEIGDIYETPFYWICFSTTKVAISIYGLANYAAHSAIRRDTSCAETGEIVPSTQSTQSTHKSFKRTFAKILQSRRNPLLDPYYLA